MRRLGTAIAFGASVVSSPAVAHGLTPGPQGIYFAFIHTLSEMPLPLALVAFGLLLGLNGLAAIKWAWPPFMLAIIVGLVGLMAFQAFLYPEWPLLVVALVNGLWAASGVKLPSYAAAFIGCLVGYYLGVFITPGPAPWSMLAYAIAGGVLAANVAVLGIFYVVHLTRKRWTMPWITVAVRVIASWVTAVAALVAALWLR